MQLPRRTLRFSIILFALSSSWLGAQAHAQIHSGDLRSVRNGTVLLPPVPPSADFAALMLPAFKLHSLPFPAPGAFSPDAFPILLRAAITEKLGAPYRLNGTGERGYDCSGFVWRVFQDIGVNFERAPARDLWDRFRSATHGEEWQFGTLVFFNDLKHVGIVRDAFSFYHASSSQGVVLSFFASYWGERITGFRRAPLQGEQNRIEIGEGESEVIERAVKTNSRPRQVSPPGTRR